MGNFWAILQLILSLGSTPLGKACLLCVETQSGLKAIANCILQQLLNNPPASGSPEAHTAAALKAHCEACK
jgi:hypothetical protein